MDAHSIMIDGKAVPATDSVEVRNPATGELIGRAPITSREQVDQAVASARAAQPGWAARPDSERSALLMQVASALSDSSEHLARWITMEQGKPLAGPGSMFEMQAVVGWTQVPASLEVPVEVAFEDDTRRDEVHRRPLGVVAAIAPWNWPLMIAIWQTVPSLRMGNTVVLKPSEYTTLATLELVKVMNSVLPPGVLNVVTGAGEIGDALVRHPGVDKVMFTGSVSTGRKIVEASAGNLSRLTLELGGNDAAIVLPDADPAAIAPGLFWGAFINMGQTCACAKRLYVHESQYDAVVDALDAVAGQMPMGNGLDEGIVLGPIQNKMQYDKVVELVEDAKKTGARIVRGGEAPGGPGYFYPITLVADIDNDARLVQEEQFGPVLPIIRYSDVEDAIAMANGVDVGLGGSVWSSDPAAAGKIAARVEAGTVWVNQHGAIHPMVPFGGAKGSGYGVEFGLEGLKAVSQPQVISYAKAG